MSDTILGAIITAIAALVAALLGVYLPRLSGREGNLNAATSKPYRQSVQVSKVGPLGCSAWLAWLAINSVGAVVAGALSIGVVHAAVLSFSKQNASSLAEDLLTKNADATPEELMNAVMSSGSLFLAVGNGLSHFLLGVFQWAFVKRLAKRSFYWLIGAALAGLLAGMLYYRPLDWDLRVFVLMGAFLPIVFAGPFIIAEMESK